MMTRGYSLPLTGVRIVEMGSLIAGPFAGKTLGEFGAEVIKIENPENGDPLRSWRSVEDQTSMWWHVQARNKKSVAINLHQPDGQALARELIAIADVVIENFRPGTLESWGLDYESLAATQPGLIMLRISGYGQTGPLRDLAGFGVVAEAMGGLRHITGYPGEPPVRPGISIGDSLAALHGVIGVMLALYERAVRGGRGQMVDVALYEAVFNMMEGALPEYDRHRMVREPAGSALQGIAPTNTYACAGGEYILIAGNGDAIFKRLMALIGRPDLGDDPVLARNLGRVEHAASIDAAIEAWTRQLEVPDALRQLALARVPAGRIYTVRDIAVDPHYAARGMLQKVRLQDGSELMVPGIVPKLSRTPGRIEGGGPSLGQHSEEVVSSISGMTPERLGELRQKGVLWP
jgi:formyl-CoA transferase